MIIRSIRILNYKCFDDSGPIIFGERLNLIVGQNNSGKTALFDGFDLQRFADKPHRDLSRRQYEALNPTSSLEATIRFSGDELYTTLMAGEAGPIMTLRAADPSAARRQLYKVFETDSIEFHLSFNRNIGWVSSDQSNLSDFQPASDGRQFRFASSADRTSWQVEQINSPSNFVASLGQLFARSAYVFKAERLNVGQCPISPPTALATDASNLAACLQNLQSNAHRFGRFVSVVQEILPSVKWVSAHVLNQTAAGISIWNADQSTERDDLRVGLEDCGTGIGQVLAIIYAVIEAQNKKILVIDEPNSFLHPSASRKLLDVLTRYDHQYIISTHSPEMITRSNPDTLHVLKRDDRRTTFERMGSIEVASLKDVLNEVGVHLSDLMGPDAIIWVEGSTEEKCFPLLFREARIELPRGASIVAVLHTGDFEAQGAKAKLAFELYERLSHANALVPPALAFVFDREGRTEQELSDLEKRGSGRIKLLPRMMYENYLLDPEAIAQVLCEEAKEKIVTDERVAEC
jgi:hypothetical protein